jgi:O-antigen/teichoic acid export membrane protein
VLSDFRESVGVVWIIVWALAPACLTLQFRYVYTALSRQGRFLGLNVAFLVVKAVVLVTLTARYGIWGACCGSVTAELLFALLALAGATSLDAVPRLARRLVAPTVGTALFVAALWKVGPTHGLAILAACVYLAMAAVVLNRQLRGARD